MIIFKFEIIKIFSIKIDHWINHNLKHKSINRETKYKLDMLVDDEDSMTENKSVIADRGLQIPSKGVWVLTKTMHVSNIVAGFELPL